MLKAHHRRCHMIDVKPDSLDLALERDTILLAGYQGTGKTYSVVQLIKLGLEQGFNIVVIDRDRGISKAVKEILGRKVPDNVDYFLTKTWDRMTDAVKYSM